MSAAGLVSLRSTSARPMITAVSYRIACQCGKGVFAELADAGGRLTCGCGRAVVVPTRNQLLRMSPTARRDSTPAPQQPETEATRTLSSAKWWFLAGVVLVAIGWWLTASVEKSPGPWVLLLGAGGMAAGGMGVVRWWVQRREQVR